MRSDLGLEHGARRWRRRHGADVSPRAEGAEAMSPSHREISRAIGELEPSLFEQTTAPIRDHESHGRYARRVGVSMLKVLGMLLLGLASAIALGTLLIEMRPR